MSLAQSMLDQYIAAEVAVLAGQSFTLDGETLTRSNLADIRAGRKEWQRTVNRGKRTFKNKTASFY